MGEGERKLRDGKRDTRRRKKTHLHDSRVLSGLEEESELVVVDDGTAFVFPLLFESEL